MRRLWIVSTAGVALVPPTAWPASRTLRLFAERRIRTHASGV